MGAIGGRGGASSLNDAYKGGSSITVESIRGPISFEQGTTLPDGSALLRFKDKLGNIVAYINTDGSASFKSVVYTPSVSGDWAWALSVPTTIAQALDSLSHKIQITLGMAKFVDSTTITGGATSFVLTHNLGTRNIHPSFMDSSNYEIVYPKVYCTTINTVTVEMTNPPGAVTYVATLIG